MKKVMKYPIYPIAFSYVFGIFFGLNFQSIAPYYVLIFIFISILYLFQHKNLGTNKPTSTLTLTYYLFIFIAFSCLGFYNYHFRNTQSKLSEKTNTELQLTITENLKSNNYYHRAYASLEREKINTKVLLYYPKNFPQIKEGFSIITVGSIKEIPTVKNPNDFNYKKHLNNKRIYYQVQTKNKPIVLGQKTNLLSFINKTQEYIDAKINKLNYSGKTISFYKALLFGHKNNLDTNLKEQFKNLGILHILAVSGMHVVLLFSTITYTLNFIRIPKKIINGILISFLITFCCVTGFTGSVVRATLMCVMVLFGKETGRNTDTITILIGSMLLILVIEPNYLFDVGFQLSYLAVFSIAFGYPILKKYFTLQNNLLNYFSQIIGISLIAQLGVLPLCLYYFKQIPLLFLLGNIIAIPLTSILLIGWFIQLIISFVSVTLANYLSPILSYIADACYQGIEIIHATFELKYINYNIDGLQTLILSLIIFMLFWTIQRPKTFKIYLLLLSLISLQIQAVYTTINNKNEILIFHDTKDILIANEQGNALYLYGNSFKKEYLDNYHIQKKFKNKPTEINLKNTFTLNNINFLIIDSLGVYPNTTFQKVIISNNAKINIDRLIEYTQPKEILLHSSNYEYLNKEYEEKLNLKKIPYYNMRNKGAYVLEL